MDLYILIENFKNKIVQDVNDNQLPPELSVEILRSITAQMDAQLKTAVLEQLNSKGEEKHEEN